MNGIDVIVNLAGENISAGRWTVTRKERIVQSRLDAGRALVAAVQAATHKPRALIQASAVGYYGPRGAEPLTEDESRPATIGFHNWPLNGRPSRAPSRISACGARSSAPALC